MESFQKDEYWMKLCLELGRKAMEAGNAPVGSVIVKNGELVGKGMEATKSKEDVICHAEVEAIRDAIEKGVNDFSDATLYSNHEPCVMCSYLIRHHKFGKIVFGITVPEIGGYSGEFCILKTHSISFWSVPPEIVSGILEEECEEVLKQYRIKKHNL
ncbi:MAG TPA: nucleoside deaminase [Cytophagales bacterium]|nr:nucleoside deaminase [Cytophagales bacterium]